MFGKRKKRAGSRTSRKQSLNSYLMKELSVTPEMLKEAVEQAPIPLEAKKAILNELPQFMEHIDEATRKIFDPSTVWLETIQFADYVSQMADHLTANHGEDCREEVATHLKYMSETWKEIAEQSMQILDRVEGATRGSQ